MYLDNRRPTITPQLAFRVAVLGGFALIMFSVIFFRLWYLQVLSGDRYVAEANDNRVRDIKVQAPRGQIVDREGRMLVDNRTALAVKITPAELPKAVPAQDDLYGRLGEVLDRSPGKIREDVNEQLAAVPFSTATVEQDVDLPVVQYLMENGDDFPGVTVERVFLRRYPHDEVGAHLFGTVGEVTEEQLDEKAYRGAEQGDRVGQSGVEATYDRYLRGRNGATRVQVDAMGRLTGSLSAKQPRAGSQLRLGVDLDVQRTGHEALGEGRRGAFVVMDVKDGEIRALGSRPSFDPNLFAKSIKQSDYDRLSDPVNGNPLANRAIQGLYPAASTFKLITAMAGLEGGLIDPATPVSDPGSLNVGGTVFKNAGNAVNGVIALREALAVSSDVYFYKLGLEANGEGNGLLIQRWARRLGIGRKTGIDIPGELPGNVPSPKWRAQINKEGVGDGRPWSAGDNINLSVGQGDLQVNPLQMAGAYATLANGGQVVTPHIGKRVEDADGRVLQELPAPTRRRVDIDPDHRTAILEGLRLAASGPKGTSTDVFKDFPIPIAGKTGTAEKGMGRPDQSWYIALAPYPNPRYVVAVTDETGGFGAETAAPAARRILAALFDVRGQEDEVVEGSDQSF